MASAVVSLTCAFGKKAASQKSKLKSQNISMPNFEFLLLNYILQYKSATQQKLNRYSKVKFKNSTTKKYLPYE